MYVGSQAGAVGTPTHAIYELSKHCTIFYHNWNHRNQIVMLCVLAAFGSHYWQVTYKCMLSCFKNMHIQDLEVHFNISS
jgi:hypothetical protein